jgi:hypothetical protein
MCDHNCELCDSYALCYNMRERYKIKSIALTTLVVVTIILIFVLKIYYKG